MEDERGITSSSFSTTSTESEGEEAAGVSVGGHELAPSPSPATSPSESPPYRAASSAASEGGGGTGAAFPPNSGMVGVGTREGAPTNMMMMMTVTRAGEDLSRKKRGGSTVAAGTVPLSSPTSTKARSPLTPFSLTTTSSEHLSSGKRGRGRPPRSGRRQLLACSLGEWFADSAPAGGDFTPHVVTVATGEDVASRILSLWQKGPRAFCILSANGAVSNVTLRQPGSYGGLLTYEATFEILSLSGSFALTEGDSGAGVRTSCRTGGISVSLAGPDGRVVGGGVAGLLLAASPIQVVVGSFMPNAFKDHKNNKKRKFNTEEEASEAARPISQLPNRMNPVLHADRCGLTTPSISASLPAAVGQNHDDGVDQDAGISANGVSNSSSDCLCSFPDGGGGGGGGNGNLAWPASANPVRAQAFS